MGTRSSVNRPRAAEANDHRIIIIINIVGSTNGIGTRDIPAFVLRGNRMVATTACMRHEPQQRIDMRSVRRTFGVMRPDAARSLLVMTDVDVGGPVVWCWIVRNTADVMLLAVFVPVAFPVVAPCSTFFHESVYNNTVWSEIVWREHIIRH